MTQSILKEAETKGFEQGWFDGLHGQAAVPQPALGIGLLDLEYLKTFKAAYLDGHATAKAELSRRRQADLLNTRQLSDQIDLENDHEH